MRWSKTPASARSWTAAADSLAAGRRVLLGLWGEVGCARMAMHADGAVQVLELACPQGEFPSVGVRHAPAIRLERALTDLTGLRAVGATDARPWLDHGRWTLRHPQGAREPAEGPAPYAFLPAEGEGLHQTLVGPIHAGTIEPGHFRFTTNGETVVRLEVRLGYAHRGLIGRMAGAPVDDAARLAGRASGDSTVAYAIAFSQAVEAALGVEAPPRAGYMRALMAELERLANHLGDIGGACNDAAFPIMLAHCGVLREQTLRAGDVAFGHRMMMDRVAPGGVSVDLSGPGQAAIIALVRQVRERFPRLVDLYDDTASLQDRTVGAGIVSPALARQFGAGGYVGRASGRDFDARRAFAYAPYDQLEFDVPIRQEGDVNARIWIRIEEVYESLALIEQILANLPAGPTRVELPVGAGEGTALVEGFRGDIFAWVRVEEDRVVAAYLRDPSWFQWPLVEAAIKGNIIADFPLCNKSFNCAYAGVDL